MPKNDVSENCPLGTLDGAQISMLYHFTHDGLSLLATDFHLPDSDQLYSPNESELVTGTSKQQWVIRGL